jgi:hypothetical protein
LRILIVNRNVERTFVAPSVQVGNELQLNVLRATNIGATVFTKDGFQMNAKDEKQVCPSLSAAERLR